MRPYTQALVVLSALFLLIPQLAAAQSAAPPPAAPPSHAPGSFADLAEKLLPAVVNISSTQKIQDPEDYPDLPQFPEGSPFEDFFNQFMDKRGKGAPSAPPASLGSGFIIDGKEGYIVTNNHVIKDAEKVRVTLHSDVTLDAEVIGFDEKTDLAVLKVKSEKPLPDVKFGSSDSLRVGDWVLAIGNPFGLGGTVTAGIVSARQRDINAGPYDDFIQTDASINRGNSGGPMFDLTGGVIGINTAIFSPSGGSVGIGFAIPSALAKPVIDQIIKYGHTRRGWIGVRIQEVTPEISESLGMPKARGALVASITPKGPAEKAGLKSGDVILTFNGQDLSDMKTLPRLVAETDIGSSAELAYWRDGKEAKVTVTVGELEKAEEEGLIASGPKTAPTGQEVEGLGLTLKSLTPADRTDYNLPSNAEGVLISHVKDGSEASEKGLLEGDLIVEMNQQKVATPDAFIKNIEEAKKAGRSSVLLLVNGGGDMRFVALKLK